MFFHIGKLQSRSQGIFYYVMDLQWFTHNPISLSNNWIWQYKLKEYFTSLFSSRINITL